MSVYTGWWSERAQRAEQDADRMAQLLEAIRERRGDLLPWELWAATQDALRDWKGNRVRRYVALPAGHTLEGNLSSGGIG
jgi:hypothetical protein